MSYFADDVARSLHLRGDNVALELVDKVFTPLFFTTVSWTGSKKKGNPDKECFNKFTHIRKFFYRLCHTVDKNYTVAQSDNFLHYVACQTSGARLHRKGVRASRVKNRPGKSAYGKRLQKFQPKTAEDADGDGVVDAYETKSVDETAILTAAADVDESATLQQNDAIHTTTVQVQPSFDIATSTPAVVADVEEINSSNTEFTSYSPKNEIYVRMEDGTFRQMTVNADETDVSLQPKEFAAAATLTTPAAKKDYALNAPPVTEFIPHGSSSLISPRLGSPLMQTPNENDAKNASDDEVQNASGDDVQNASGDDAQNASGDDSQNSSDDSDTNQSEDDDSNVDSDAVDNPNYSSVLSSPTVTIRDDGDADDGADDEVIAEYYERMNKQISTFMKRKRNVSSKRKADSQFKESDREITDAEETLANAKKQKK